MKQKFIENIGKSILALISALVVGTSALSAHALGRKNVGLNAGMATGGFTLGGDFEYLMKRSYGLSGFARFYQKDEDRTDAPGLFVFGANARIHQRVEMFDVSIAPGFAIVNIDGNSKDATSLGPSLSVAAVYALKDDVFIGLENSRYYVWFDKDYRGIVMDDTSLRLTFNF